MKKIILQIIALIITTSFLYGQADTLLVPSTVDGDPFGAINKFIIGDTTASGDRANPDRFYKLEKDQIYFLDGELHSHFYLRLIADEPQGSEKPPIVASTAGADGVIQLIQFKLFDHALIKNIVFQMTPPSGNGESNACFFLSGEGKNYEFDNIMIEWGLWTGMTTEVPVNKIVVRNCYFKNVQHKTNIWNGRGVNFFMENPADTVIMQNNSFFNNNSFAFSADISSIPPNYFLFDHNTIVNSMKFPIHSFWLPNATVTNNLFYNAHSYGENDDDVVGQDPQLLKYGIINISEIPSDLISYYNITEEERSYTVANNGFYYADEIRDYWSDYNLDENPFMNSRVTAMFANNAALPNLDVSNTIVENPEFINAGEGMTAMIEWMGNRRDLMGNTYWGWDPDNDKFGVQFPFLEDLAYTNEALRTGADGGFPIGDLNWWPEEKEQWEAGLTISVKDIGNTEIQSMSIAPSPASDQLTISYTLNENSDIDISIFDIKGSEIATILNGTQQKGAYNIDWSINNTITNGMYLIRISDKLGSITRKVMIQK